MANMRNAPDPKDVQDFLFKQANVEQIFEGKTLSPEVCNLVACDGKRGLLYIAHDNNLTVVKPGTDAKVEWKLNLVLPDTAIRLSLNCDCSYLAVAFPRPSILIYIAESLSKNTLELLREILVSSSSDQTRVTDLRWNPAIPGMLSTVASDYSVGCFQIEGNKTLGSSMTLERLSSLEPECIAWSPKGKQLVIGCRNGNLVQLKPDLKLARAIAGPSPGIGGVMSILWLSNYQFCTAYYNVNERNIIVVVVDAPKGQEVATFTRYDDIMYRMPGANNNLPRFYFDYISEWGIIIAASNDCSEIVVLGTNDNGATWEQWQLVDSGRAELPLVRTVDSFPVGIALDKTSAQILAMNGDVQLPNPVPILHILGTSGQLCSFHAVNLKPGCSNICSPPGEVVPPPPPIETSTPLVKQAQKIALFAAKTAGISIPSPITPRVVPMENLATPENVFLVPSEPPEVLRRPMQDPPKPVEIPNIPKPRLEKVQAAKIPVPKEAPEKEKVPIDEGICLRAYREEQAQFEKELAGKLAAVNWECGTEDERQELVEKSAFIEEFLARVRETTDDLANDVSYLKSLLLQSSAWLEETKSKSSFHNNAGVRVRNDTGKMEELQRLLYYTKSQLLQALKAMDLKCADRNALNTQRMKIPSLEFIFQSLVMHSQIIKKQKSVVDGISKKAKKSDVSALDQSMSNLSVTLNSNDGVMEAKCKAIVNKKRSFCREKQLRLQNLLGETTPRTVKVMNPTSMQDRLERTLSSLAVTKKIPADPKPKVKVAEKPKLPSKPKATLNFSPGVATPPSFPKLDAIVFGATQKSPEAKEILVVPEAPKTEFKDAPSSKALPVPSAPIFSFSAEKPASNFAFPVKSVQASLELSGLTLGLQQPEFPISQANPVTTVAPLPSLLFKTPQTSLFAKTSPTTISSPSSIASGMVIAPAFCRTTTTAATEKAPSSSSPEFGTATTAPSMAPQVPVPSTASSFSFLAGATGATSFSSSVLSDVLSGTSSLTFGNPSSPITITSVFGKTTVAPPAENAFAKPAVSFGAASPGSVFGNANSGTGNASIFGGGASAATSGFGSPSITTVSINSPGFANVTAAAAVPSFATATTTTSVFGASSVSSSSVFGSSGNASVFGAAAAAAATAATPGENSIFARQNSVFGGGFGQSSMFGSSSPGAFGAASTSPGTLSRSPPSVFGQSATFGAKAAFNPGSSEFGMKPVFGGGFGAPAFGASAPATGFGGPPALGAAESMKVFGGGGNSFETLAGQSGNLSFSSLAQNTTEPEKAPSFSGGSSFSSWR